jgi:hypothetical protein
MIEGFLPAEYFLFGMIFGMFVTYSVFAIVVLIFKRWLV